MKQTVYFIQIIEPRIFIITTNSALNYLPPAVDYSQGMSWIRNILSGFSSQRTSALIN